MARILVVDNHHVYQRMYSYILRKHGHTVLIAPHGQAALDSLTNNQIDLIITDGTMTEADSTTLIKKVRAHEYYNNLPVIMLIAFGQHRPDKDKEAHGANAYLSKPTSSRELIDTVHRLLGGRIIGGLG
jgi:CheY-like chemotaxis protein